jgi:hypothetical protein
MKETIFILVKKNLICKTKDISIVEKLKAFGWKIKQNELSNLI